MFKKINSWVKSVFTLNKSEQRAILFTLFLILIVITINLTLPYLIRKGKNDYSTFRQEIENFRQAQQMISDSIRIEQLQNRGELNEELAEQKLNPFPFNPNQLPEEAWLQLGLSEKQVKTIKNYEAKGGKFNRKEDLKKMYSISDAEYTILEPYIRIPTPYKSKISPIESNIEEKKPVTRKIRFMNVEINSADSSAFVNSLKLPPWIASRIISYREILGGYYKANQLKEVYGFDSTYFTKIEKYLLVDTSLIVPININTAGFKEILRHPYISFDMTKEIVNHRNSRGLFKSTYQLIELGILSESTYIKVKPYLSVKKD
jgi:DNA uptake protein ComE-like DNA-binding protein